ncbi:MAG TPA: PKD domain-containing protein, partial [Thermoplasmata archaeon]|nr:PKD domain-containing protein [Thermoplasmata archaeon]
FDLPTAKWGSVPAEIGFATVLASVAPGAVWWNLTLSNASGLTGAVSWTSEQAEVASDSFLFGGLARGFAYGFSVDGGAPRNASMNAGALEFGWTGSGPHHFALVALGASPPPTPLDAFVTASPAGGSVPLPVHFAATVFGGLPPYGYRWEFGDGSFGLGGELTHVYGSAGYYTVVLQVTDAASGSARVTTTVDVAPSASTNLSVACAANWSKGEADWPTAFAAGAVGGTAPYGFQWNFGDGSPEAGAANVSHNYALPGNYTASVTVTDRDGRSATDTTSIAIVPRLTSEVLLVAPTVTIGNATTVFGLVTGGIGPFRFLWSGAGPGPPDSESFVLRPTSPGDLPIALAVSDSLGASASAAFLLTVNAVPVPPPAETRNSSPVNEPPPTFPPPFALGILGAVTLTAGAIGLAVRRRRARRGPPSKVPAPGPHSIGASDQRTSPRPAPPSRSKG